MMVTNDEHRAFAEDVWKLPKGTIPSKIGFDAVAQSRALKDSKLRVYWTQVTNNIQAGPNLMQDRKSTRLNSSHVAISYAVFCLKKKRKCVVVCTKSAYAESLVRD